MVTLSDISRETGLSTVTVSHVLNGRAGFSVRTQERVREAARRLGYRPNPLARGLQGKATRSVGIVWSLGRPAAEGFVRQIALHLWQRGYVTVIVDSLSDPKIIGSMLADMNQRGVDGVILQANAALLEHAEILRQLAVPRATVVVSDYACESAFDQVVQDVPGAVAHVMDYWAATGRQRPCFFGSSSESAASSEPFRTFQAKLQAHGWPVDAALIQRSPGGRVGRYFEHYRGALIESFDGKPFPYDAILCAGDDGAAATLAWLRERGVAVGEAVAVVGRGNLDWLEGMQPALASIETHDDTAADLIAELLFDRLGNTDSPPQTRVLPASFVWRASAGRALATLDALDSFSSSDPTP